MSGVPLGADYSEVTDLNPEGHAGGDKGGDRNAVRPLTEAPHPSPSAPPDSDCDACSVHSCRRSNTQVGCTSTLKAHQARTLLVGNTLFMMEPVEA